MIAGTLEIQMLANMARLADDMQKSKQIVTGAMKDIESAVATAKAALGALGIGLGIGYFVSLIKGTIDAADHLEHLTKSTSLTVTELAGLKLLGAETGTDLDGLAKAIDKMSVAMGKDPGRFAALGVTAKDNKEAFKQLADIFNSLTDVQQRNALAQAVFSKSWMEVAPALSLGGKAIGEIMDKGAQLSGITKEMTDQAHAFKVQMAELETTLGATRVRLVGELLPGLSDIAKAMQEAAKEGGLLLAVWVGLGGALQMLALEVRKLLGLPMTEIAALEKDSKHITDYLAGLSTSVNPGVRLRYEEQLRVVTARLELLRQEKKIADAATAAKPPTPVDAAAAAAAAERARIFLANKEKEIYAARVAAIHGAAATYIAEIKTQETLADLAFKEGGINNQRTQEELILRQSALADKKLHKQLEEFTQLEALAKEKGKTKDVETNAALIIQTNAAIADNETITQARIRAARTVTAQQQIDQYNADIDARAALGAGMVDAMRDATDRENDAYKERLVNLSVFVSQAQDQIVEDAAWREGLEIQHQQNLLEIERNKHQAERGMQIGTWQLGAELLQSMAGKSKLAAIAVIAINKALAIAQVIQSTSVAVMRAFADLGPIAGIPAAASIKALGAVQIGLIAATGLIQAANVGGGGASLGSPANPVSTTGGAGFSQAPAAAAPMNVYVNVTGVVTQEVVTQLIAQLKDEIGNRDAIIIPQNSRQAADIAAL